MYDQQGHRLPNIHFLKQHLIREGKVTEEQAMFLLGEATKIMTKEKNMLEVQGPITGESSVY